MIALSGFITCDACYHCVPIRGPLIADLNDDVSRLIAAGWVSEIDGQDVHRCKACADAAREGRQAKHSPVCTVVDKTEVGRNGNLTKSETTIRR